MSARLHRRRRMAWRTAWFRDGFCIGVLVGIIAYGLWTHVIAQVFG